MIISAVRATPQGIVVRVYEAHGQATNGVHLRSAAAIETAEETNIIESEGNPVAFDADSHNLAFDIGAFEIKTFLFKLVAL